MTSIGPTTPEPVHACLTSSAACSRTTDAARSAGPRRARRSVYNLLRAGTATGLHGGTHSLSPMPSDCLLFMQRKAAPRHVRLHGPRNKNSGKMAKLMAGARLLSASFKTSAKRALSSCLKSEKQTLAYRCAKQESRLPITKLRFWDCKASKRTRKVTLSLAALVAVDQLQRNQSGQILAVASQVQ